MSTPRRPRPRGSSPMAAAGLLVDPARQEARELAASLVEDAERDLACPREVGGRLQEPVEDRLEVELGQ